MRNIIFNEGMKKLIYAIWNPNPDKLRIYLRVAISFAIEIEISEEMKFFVINNLLLESLKYFSIAESVICVDELSKELKSFAFRTAFSKFPEDMEHIK